MPEHQHTHDHHVDGVEDPVEETYSAATEEGAERLHRSWRALITTGFLGGVEISVGVLAYILTLHETGSPLLAGLAFSVGFIALYLAHSELFTEGFYYPFMAIFDGRGTWTELVRLWVVTLLSNLVGGWLTIWLVVVGLPELVPKLTEKAHHFLDIGLSWQGAALAVLAGLAITLMTRMHAGTDNPSAIIAASVTGAFILTGASLFHSVLDSIIIFGAIHADAPGIGYLDWLGWIWWVIPLNILGGLLFTTAPRLIRSREAREQPSN
ncbi:formate/nitrite transporter family protein [uncultured Corynebacterium sp.]|uniref:formate/nitrite transporter family protein n=1 Tax=uncultured Corynebacterium sp. TaxID=159447 RepID=UPI0025E18FA9|nr:formate/nitrite transporter family protein [uncultured Corynebacterium sp.]